MRNALTALISAASFAALATCASAQTLYPYPYGGSAPTIPSRTGAPLYSYHHTGPQPGVVGSCQIIAGNRVCSATPAMADSGYVPYGYGAGPIGMLVGAPFAIVAAPFGGFGQPVMSSGETYAPATGTPAYSYESHVGYQPAVIGHCELIAGNRVCSAAP